MRVNFHKQLNKVFPGYKRGFVKDDGKELNN